MTIKLFPIVLFNICLIIAKYYYSFFRMSDSGFRVISLPPISITSSPAIPVATSSPIEIYSSSSESHSSSSSSSALDPFVAMNQLIKSGYYKSQSPPCTIWVPCHYHIMSDDETSHSGPLLANAPTSTSH